MRFFRFFSYFVVCVLLSGEFGCDPSHERVFSNEHLMRARADELNATEVSPHLEVEVGQKDNVIWCSTFQLAWNEACELVGEYLHFDEDAAMVDILNKRTANASDIDSESYVAMAGYVRDGIFGKIKAALALKFGGAASARLIGDSFGMRPQDIVAYAYLFKNLEFPEKFERLDRPVEFDGSKVACFGVGEEFKGGHVQMYDQVLILDYKSEDDYIIELQTKSPVDQVILAKIRPGDTLEATIKEISERISAGDSVKMQAGDILKVPKFNFDIYRNYTELLGRRLKVKNPDVAKDLGVLSARQSIRFEMDEEGVKLRSESQMSFGCSAAFEPEPKHIMIFDKPFIVLMKKKDSEIPYFGMWVANSELLVPWK